jgi:hypothetical protein
MQQSQSPWASEGVPVLGSVSRDVPRQDGHAQTPLAAASWKDVMLNQAPEDDAGGVGLRIASHRVQGVSLSSSHPQRITVTSPQLQNVDPASPQLHSADVAAASPRLHMSNALAPPPYTGGSRPVTPQPMLATSRPGTPKQATPASSEPYRIKPFSSFVASSPNHRVRKSRRSLKPALSMGRNKRSTSAWSTKSRRVSFAPAKGDEEDDDDDNDMDDDDDPDDDNDRPPLMSAPSTPMRRRKTRQLSPPPDPAVAPDISEQDVAAAFSKHFSTVSRRRAQQQQQKRPLLPAESQQVRESPAHDAMARAFIAADGGAHADSDVDMGESEGESSVGGGSLPVRRRLYSPPPRRSGGGGGGGGDAASLLLRPHDVLTDQESASEIDIVDEVVSNIDSFLNPGMDGDDDDDDDNDGKARRRDDDDDDEDMTMATPRARGKRLPQARQSPWTRGLLGI